MPTTATGGVTRGCGARKSGGVYVECGLSDRGVDISNFMLDPVTAFEMDTHRGQEIREREGTYHLFDHVGAAHYPTAADIYEEVRRHGASRRASPTQKFELLSPDSRMILVHPRARALSPGPLAKIERALSLPQMPAYKQKCMLYRKSGGKNTAHFDCAPESTPPCTRFWWLDAGWERPVDRASPFGEAPSEKTPPEETPQGDTPSGDASYVDLPRVEIPGAKAPGAGDSNRQESNSEEIGQVAGLNFPYPTSEDGRLVRVGTRVIGDTGFQTYGGPLKECSTDTGPIDVEFDSGIVFSLPITAITVIDSADQTAEERLEDLKGRSTIPVTKQPE